MIFAVALMAIFALLSKRVALAANVLSIGVWVSLVTITTFTRGVHSPVVMCFPLVIMSVGWVHSIRMAMVITTLTIVATVALAVAEIYGSSFYTLESSTVVQAGDQIVVYLVSASLITFFVKLYRFRLSELHQLSIELTHKNQAFEQRTLELKRAQSVAKIGSWITDLVTNQIRISVEAGRILGLDSNQILDNRQYLNLVHPDDHEDLKQAWQLALNMQDFDHEHRIVVQGNVRWVRQKAEFDFDPSGLPVSAAGIVQDVSALKQAQLALKASEDRYRTLIEWSPDAILAHRAGHIVYANPAAVRLFGAPYAQVLLEKKTVELIHPDYVESQTKRMHAIYKHEVIPAAVESKFLRLDGQVIDVEVQGTAIDFDGEPAIQVVIRDISKRKLIENRVRQLAFYDDLTLLPNRRLLHDRLNQAIASQKRTGNFGAVMFLDLDNFKPLNDRFGHSLGDQLLIEVAQRLKGCVREMDTTARFGGDEFVVAVEELTSNLEESKLLVRNLAEKIRTCLSEPYQLATTAQEGASESVCHQCTASIGVAMISDLDSTPDDLVKWADSAMYHAKSQGRNCIEFYVHGNSLFG
jgi:diguanylate cyclase (GGDEF)-like protein/PAS domain S-box-containing protein